VKRIIRGGVPVALLAAALLLAGCGSDRPTKTSADEPPAASTSAPAGRDHNATDVMFAQMMVPHHGQGIEIVKLATERATNPELKTLAAAIEATQRTEAQTMAGWLETWGEPPTATQDEHAAHGGMPGTSAAEIAGLTRHTGAAFDTALLNMLIAHQDDAIQLARSETASGANAEAKALAERIDKSRTAQISQLLAMLKK
jgi:uncharacterized protein (DUF305 family)